MRILKRIMAVVASLAAVLGASVAVASPALAVESVPGCKVYYPADTLIVTTGVGSPNSILSEYAEHLRHLHDQ